jgi:multicomponent Na+:H+ antiporter subunit E
MIPFILTAIFAFLMYLLFTAGSGAVGLWSMTELVTGGVLSLVIAVLSRSYFCTRCDIRMANPIRWLYLVVYAAVPFFLEMAKANIDVAYRVVTGRIRPGIVRISPGLKSDLGVLFLANSITLTPGTLTVDVDEETNDLFVHMINIERGMEKDEVTESEDMFALFRLPEWIRRIAE